MRSRRPSRRSARELEASSAVFAVDYRGISVPQAAELRTKLREADASFTVVKNRLAKRVTADAGAEALDEHLIGPTALTYVKGDAVIAAKAITDFIQEHETIAYKGGIMDGKPLDPEQFKAIARLPGVDVLRGQLVGMAARAADRHRPQPQRPRPGPRHPARPDRRTGPGRRRRAGRGARRRGGAGRGGCRGAGGGGRAAEEAPAEEARRPRRPPLSLRRRPRPPPRRRRPRSRPPRPRQRLQMNLRNRRARRRPPLRRRPSPSPTQRRRMPRQRLTTENEEN